MNLPDIRTAHVIRYVTPLREGGSMPAIVDADDGFPYVLKFRGAGQGKKALVAELIGGEMARRLGLNMPEQVFLHLDASFSKTEPDEEIQDLLKFSVGLNLGLHFLSGALTYDPQITEVDPLMASKVVLLDSLITNIDRTPRNPNLLLWKRELWLIDHGACLYFHHNWINWQTAIDKTFPPVKDNILLPQAARLEEAEVIFRQQFDSVWMTRLLACVPDEWLVEETDSLSPAEKREAYLEFLLTRLSNIHVLTKEANDARATGF